MSFTDIFNKMDTQVFNILGDDITVTPKDGEAVTIKAPFYLVHDDDALLDRVDGDYPHLKDVKSSDLYLFKKGTLVEVNVDGDATTFEYQTKNPNGANTWEIELRTKVETW